MASSLAFWKSPSERETDRCRGGGSSLIQSELPLCESLWSDLCLRQGQNLQDGGLLGGEIAGGRGKRAETKLPTLQKVKRRHQVRSKKSTATNHFIFCDGKHPSGVWDLPFCRDYFIYGPLDWFVVVYSISCVRLFVMPMDCNLPDSSVHGLSQARILEWSAISSSSGSSRPRNWTRVSCIGRRILYHWVTREAHRDLIYRSNKWTRRFHSPSNYL